MIAWVTLYDWVIYPSLSLSFDFFIYKMILNNIEKCFTWLTCLLFSLLEYVTYVWMDCGLYELRRESRTKWDEIHSVCLCVRFRDQFEVRLRSQAMCYLRISQPTRQSFDQPIPLFFFSCVCRCWFICAHVETRSLCQIAFSFTFYHIFLRYDGLPEPGAH